MPVFSKRTYLMPAIGILLVGAIIVALIQIPAMAKSRLSEKLAEAGFKDVQIGIVSVRPSAVVADNIKLDQYGFDEIRQLSADISWPSFLMGGKIRGLNIEGVHLGRDSATIGAGARQLINTLLQLPDYRITLSGVTLDVTTDFGEIRLTAQATLNADNNPDERDIKARVMAAQYQLGFDSMWQGTLKEDGQLDLAATLVDGRLNIGPLRISRFNGWIGAAASEGKVTLQSQMEAGSASFMDMPLQNLSLVNDLSDGRMTAIFRSGVSGVPDVLFTADMVKSETEQNFTAILKGENLGNFLDYVEEATGKKKIIRDELVHAGKFELVSRFESEKRFVGGPMPFSIVMNTDNTKTLDGNFLFYPDTLDVRGSLETSNDMALALQDYFKIPATNMRQNYIRLDGDARRFFMMGPAAAPQTSAKPAAGEITDLTAQ